MERKVSLPAATYFLPSLALLLGLLFYAAWLVFPLRWSWRILRQPAGECSEALRRLARWTFPLSVAGFVACVLLLWAVPLFSEAA